jgi:hypothetical protein
LLANRVAFESERLDKNRPLGRRNVFAQARPEFVVVDEQFSFHSTIFANQLRNLPALRRLNLSFDYHFTLSRPALIVFDPDARMNSRRAQTAMLHIHNGDSAAETAKKSAIPGTHLAWREALVCGPAPGGLSATEFRRVRARHLADAYGVEPEKCENELRGQEEALARFSDHEEVVLWFECDLFCEIQLIYLLDWFAERELGQTKLSLICIGEFPGIEVFHGLGQLNEAQLASLFPQRQCVTAEQLQLGSRAWAAYSSSNPIEIESLLESDLAPLPFLKSALVKHLQRFPSTDNGLGRVGNVGLELIAKGFGNFRSLFPAFMRREPEYGFGDAQLYLELRRLTNAKAPLLKLSGGGDRAAMNPAQMLLSSFEITEHGKAVLAGDQDFVASNGIDHWLGGVHLKGSEAQWRWEERAQELLKSL